VGLKPEVMKKLCNLLVAQLLKFLVNMDSPRKYYENLLEEAPLNDKGYLKIQPDSLKHLIKM
jgi:hypothetical protein